MYVSVDVFVKNNSLSIRMLYLTRLGMRSSALIPSVPCHDVFMQVGPHPCCGLAVSIQVWMI